MKTSSNEDIHALYKDQYQKLNKAQKQAVDAIEGPLLVVAGPGSGKTQILSLRVANILQSTDARPSNILCLTFTDSAALNMRDRLARLMGEEAYRVAIHTFHNFCVNIIQRYPEFFYGGAFFTTADTLAQRATLEGLFDALSHDNPLRSIHPEQGYVYIRDASDAISNLKKAGITSGEFKKILDENEEELKSINQIISNFADERLSKKLFGDIEEAVGKLEKLAHTVEIKNVKKGADFLGAGLKIHSLAEVAAKSLRRALDNAIQTDETAPLSDWKEKMTRKDDDKKRVFRDTLGLERMRSVADIYADYRKVMHERGMYDFDDMIIDVIEAVEKYPRLRAELQEQYQYMLVDEFQDTNDAQMRLLRLIADADVNEGRPNIMVVGDDDQAVYKFQGAELSNIKDFKNSYKDVVLVTMTENYRSTQSILDVASHIIKKGKERLVNVIPEMEKELIASNDALKTSGGKSIGSILRRSFPSALHEYHFVSREIKRLIDSGHKPEEIAVIARHHKELEALVPYMQGAQVAIRYEREQNVFLEPHIHQLIVMARFIESLNSKGNEEADEYMPEILSYPFWGVSRKDIWEISTEAGRGKISNPEADGGLGNWRSKPWLSIMSDHKDSRIRAIAKLLLELGVKAKHEPLEKTLDMMIGAHVVLSAESEDEDEDVLDIGNHFSNKENLGRHNDPENDLENKTYVSPFKEFYFSKERFEHARTEYLSFLSSLRVFVGALREYKGRHAPDDVLVLSDLVEFVDLHEKNKIPLNDRSPFGYLGSSVNLLSAHKAKGLEFETVFVLSCQDSVWAGRGMPNKLPFPTNLENVEPAGDNEDDQLRLFYVALTRAKKNLYITSYEMKDNGDSSQALRFLVSDEFNQLVHHEVQTAENMKESDAPLVHELLTASWLRYNTPPFIGEERKLLESLLENYQLSVTHLNNFLNVEKGGPQVFLEQNLLRFPQTKSLSGAYGSAIHHTLEKIGVEIRRDVIYGSDDKAKDSKPSKEDVLRWFTEYLKRERLSRTDFQLYESRGKTAITAFYDVHINSFNVLDKTEFDFRHQGVIVGGKDGAHVTGKIDRIVEVTPGLLEVHDYKTGKSSDSWKGKNAQESIKLYQYQRQLLFYKLLVEHSKDLGKFKVQKGILDFVEPASNYKIVSLSADLDNEAMERLLRLTNAVYKKIINLDFPDISKYPKTLAGIQEFEEDLLSE